MANLHPEITPELQTFIEAQPVFFVATAPLSPGAHINVSPKGLAGTFRILTPTQVAYLDLTGSGNETAAHLLENGRITFMFCAFEDPAKILRLYGSARTIRPDNPQWPDLAKNFPEFPGMRQIVLAQITRVQTSCGWGVPLMHMDTQRETLPKWAAKKGPTGIADYQQRNNRVSIDGLPTGPANI
jgi:hypothetical protein